MLFQNLVIVAGLIIASLLIWGTPKKSASTNLVQWNVFDYYDHLHANIQAADTIDKILDLRNLIDEFYNKKYKVQPSCTIRRALRKSLMQAYARKVNDLSKVG